MSRWLPVLVLACIASCQQQACPSTAGGACDPRHANCPTGYVCALAEVCTRPCAQHSDCWVKASDGCRATELPGQRLPDGGVYSDSTTEDGFCPETKLMECIEGACQSWKCNDGGCDYDVYGPSPFKGNRSQGPQE